MIQNLPDSEHFLILSEFSVSDLSLADTGWYKVSWPQMEVQWVLCPPATYREGLMSIRFRNGTMELRLVHTFALLADHKD